MILHHEENEDWLCVQDGNRGVVYIEWIHVQSKTKIFVLHEVLAQYSCYYSHIRYVELTSGSSTSSMMVPKSLFTSFPLSENHLLNKLWALTSTSCQDENNL
jgi:hypothetical protein